MPQLGGKRKRIGDLFSARRDFRRLLFRRLDLVYVSSTMSNQENDDEKNDAAGAGRSRVRQKSAAEIRKERLARELRANLMRRKSQNRARRAGDEDGRSGALAVAADSGDSENGSKESQ